MSSNKAAFLDRDGVINDGSLYYTFRTEDFKLNPDIPEALLLLQNAGYRLIVITNQSGIAKGEYTCADVENVHNYMKQILAEYGVRIDGVYYCPHHPSVSECDCRKPKNKLLLDAIADFDIDRNKSFMIGDSARDIEAANRTEIVGYKIDKNDSILNLCRKIVNET